MTKLKTSIWLLIIATLLILLAFTDEIFPSDVDMDSLKGSCPVNKCCGGQVKEIKKSVFACNHFVKKLKVNIEYTWYEPEINPFGEEPIVSYIVLEWRGNYCRYITFYKGIQFVNAKKCWMFDGSMRFVEVEYYKAKGLPVCEEVESVRKEK